MAAGLLAICLGALGGGTLYLKATDAHPVLVATKVIARGDKLAPGDLGVVQLAIVPGLRTVAADELPNLTGQDALVDMAAGTLVTPDSVGTWRLRPGTVRVGLRLAPGRLPLRQLSPGSSVLLISIPADSPQDGEAAFEPQIFSAVVESSPQESTDGGGQVLDVAVAREASAVLVGLAALDRLSLVAE